MKARGKLLEAVLDAVLEDRVKWRTRAPSPGRRGGAALAVAALPLSHYPAHPSAASQAERSGSGGGGGRTPHAKPEQPGPASQSRPSVASRQLGGQCPWPRGTAERGGASAVPASDSTSSPTSTYVSSRSL